MKYIEQKKGIHRDLAARNVLVAPGDGLHKVTVKIGDFGLSRISRRSYYMSTSKTIPFKWSAPEVLVMGAYSNRSDVWSFGILMWEVFSFGKIPFPTIQNSELLQALNNKVRPEQPENCPDEVYEVMQQCWQFIVKERPAFSVNFVERNEVTLERNFRRN
jgi:serine/threonine protein kinase